MTVSHPYQKVENLHRCQKPEIGFWHWRLHLIVFGGKKGSSHDLKKATNGLKVTTSSRPTDNLKIWCETFWHAEEVILNTYVSKLVSFAWDFLVGLKLSFDLYTSVILCIRMSSSIIHFFSSHHMHPFGNNCCRKKPFNLRAFKVGISGESRGGVPGDTQPLSLGLDDRPLPPRPSLIWRSGSATGH